MDEVSFKDLAGFYRGRRCFLTGHTGFKGAWLALWLRQMGAEITGYALDPLTEPSLFALGRVADGLRDVRGDIRDAEPLRRAMAEAKPEIVLHLAAQAIVTRSYEAPKETFDTNVGGTVNLLEAARACPSVRTVVVVTSDKCYENREWPHAYRETDALGGYDPYSASKGAAELVCAAYRRSFFEKAGIGLASARAGNVIGGGDWAKDRIVPDAVRALQAGQPIVVRNPLSVRPWQHVLEPLHGYLLLAARLSGSLAYAGAWNFGPPTASCQTVQNLVDTFLATWGSGSWERAGEGVQSGHEAGLLALDSQKAWLRLGWQPHWAFEHAIARTSAWYRRQFEGESPAALCAEDLRDYAEHA